MIKKLKAFEIIKKKEVDVGLFNNCSSLQEYHDGLFFENYGLDMEALELHTLTKEEFDLLKEVL